MNTSFINRRRNLVEPKPKNGADRFHISYLFSPQIFSTVLIFIVGGAMIFMMNHTANLFRESNAIEDSMSKSCEFTPASESRGEGLGLVINNGDVGFVTPNAGGKDILVEATRTEKQLTFTNLESHKALCSIKL
jgi:hypothetical protein